MKAVCPRMVVVITGMALMGAGRAAAGTHTWTGAVSADWTAGGNWAGGPLVAGGDVVVPAGTTFAPAIPAGTNPVSGVYSSFTVASGATVTCLGDPTAVNEPSGGTAAKPHGIGVTIFTVNATIDGTLSAFGQGFRNNQGPGNVGGGASHGGKGNGAPWGTTYGSLTQPTALGTGGDGAATPARVGGGAIRLVVEETLSLGGTIDASAPNTDWSGSGGSIWLTMSNFTGSGVIKAEGGKSTPVAGSAGGGRVALVYTHSTFSGYVSVARGAGKDAATRAGEAGTLWEPKRFDGMAGTPESPATMLITNSYQYYFPDAGVTNHWNLNVSNAWFETHQGSLAIPNLHVHNGVFGFDRYAENRKHETDMNYLEITNRIRVTGNATANLIAKTYTLPGGVTVGSGSVLGIRGNTNAVNPESGGTTGNPHGTGVTIISPTVTIDGTLSGVGGGFGHGKGPGCGFDGSAHGGKGGTVGSSTYGSLTRPTALGSGGAAGSASREGGGAIRLVVGGTLDVNGAIDVSAPSNDRAGSGGSIWLTVSNLTGRGVIKAEGGGPTVHPFLGGGGRIAIDYTNSTFTGLLSLAGGKLGTTFIGQPGTLWEPKMFAGKTGDPQAPQAILITNSFQYHFPDATLTNYWNLTVSNAWFEPHQGPLQLSDLLLTNALFRFDRYAHGEPTVPDTSFFEIANDLRVTGVSKLYLPPRTYA
ncbi:MAG: hypothetical protein GX548_10135, partial [Lentisphaerae bacterium]|nr:hypothetical protein [Lentisphaerota bacterium]